MTLAQKRPANPRLSNGFISSLKKQFPDLIPPTIAITIFLVLWQRSHITRANTSYPRHLGTHSLAIL